VQHHEDVSLSKQIFLEGFVMVSKTTCAQATMFLMKSSSVTREATKLPFNVRRSSPRLLN
jgi:Asp-tRNA(Asn)/Glu-tRNA(Gln) amidotransferase A subunit family amidase